MHKPDAATPGLPPNTADDPERLLGEAPHPVTVLDDLRFAPLAAHPARVYAYWLGGKDPFEADRVTAEEVIRLRPQVVAGARANRRFHLFDGLALVPPGVVPVAEWRPSAAPFPHRHTADLYAGIARVRQGCR